jgi:hypothetical protein
MASNSVEYHFLKRSLEQFAEDLKKVEEVISKKIFTQEELLEIMGYLVSIKENIEILEIKYQETI